MFTTLLDIKSRRKANKTNLFHHNIYFVSSPDETSWGNAKVTAPEDIPTTNATQSSHTVVYLSYIWEASVLEASVLTHLNHQSGNFKAFGSLKSTYSATQAQQTTTTLYFLLLMMSTMMTEAEAPETKKVRHVHVLLHSSPWAWVHASVMSCHVTWTENVWGVPTIEQWHWHNTLNPTRLLIGELSVILLTFSHIIILIQNTTISDLIIFLSNLFPSATTFPPFCWWSTWSHWRLYRRAWPIAWYWYLHSVCRIQ